MSAADGGPGTADLLAALEGLSAPRVLIVGDLILDSY